MEPGVFSILATKIVEGSPLIVLLLIGAVIALWKEIKRERDARILQAEKCAQEFMKIANDYNEFSVLITQHINATRK